ncbi:MAG: ribosome biogenesis GTPase YlqF [Clostridia bacterium]|nr:ribosome biogenesis GTPase YlqF [Clostridia bacterium]
MNEDTKKLPSTNINWFPGHMAKTRRQITEDLKLIDIVIELLDARIPLASRNPDIKEITKNKKKIILLNKCDLADDKLNQKWVEALSKEAPTILTDSNSGKGIDKVLKKIDEIMEPEKIRQQNRGIKNKTIRVMILGIPNVGKSSFINRIAKRNTVVVGNKPGVTKQKQWIRIGKNIELLDTPGVLWPKFQDEKIALNLAFTGTIKDDILERIEIAYELLKKLYAEYPRIVKERFKITDADIEFIEQQENKIYELMKVIGQKRGALISGGEVDDEKVSRIILDDFRSGKMGKISLEKP